MTVEYRKEKRKAVVPIIFEGLVEVTVGDIIILMFLVPGVLDREGQTIVGILGVVFLAVVVALAIVARNFKKGLESA